MANIEDGDSSKKARKQTTATTSKIKIILLLLSTNLLSIYLFSSPTSFVFNSNPLLKELNSTQSKLSQSQNHITSLQTRLSTTNALLETILTNMGQAERESSPPDGLQGWKHELSGELKLAVGPYKLPFGFTPNIGSDELHPALGSQCAKLQDEVERYMDYKVGGECPGDDIMAQKLMLRGCEPLPRRRCHPKSPKGYAGPSPWPEGLWATPSDTSIVWDPYTCKNYSCLVNRGRSKGSYDCKDCFDLNGREKSRWLHDSSDLDYSIDTVLSLKPKGTIRIGLDIGGGSGSFAARMKEKGGATIVTTSMNFDGPFNSFIASRGLVPLHLSVGHRLPFYENTLDIVHSMHVLSNWIPDLVLEFALYDVYRVLRPGGIFWLDHFFCTGEQVNETYVPMFEGIGFNKIRWDAGRKLDRGIEKNEWYLSALLEKPMT